MKYVNIRKQSYAYHQKHYSYIFRWPWYSYRKHKAYFYMEFASILVFIFLKIGILPNVVTLIYILLSIITGILLTIPSKVSIFIAVGLIFFKPTFDWADGLLARIKKMTSIDGDLFDYYSASVGWIFLWSGLGVYLGNSTSRIFYYLTPIIPALFALDIYSSARERFVHHYFIKSELRKVKIEETSNNAESLYNMPSRLRKIKDFIDTLFEDNTRTVDIIGLIILIELFSSMRILWIFYSSFLVWQIIIFAARLFLITRGGWTEAELAKFKNIIYKDN